MARRTRVVATFIATLLAGMTLPSVPAIAASVEWDTRLVPIVDAVEELRGLEFERPVEVEFLRDAKFRERVAVDRGKLSDADKAEIVRNEAQLRAIGLLPAGVDLLGSVSDLQESGVLAYYDPTQEKVTVRGKKLDVARRVTLAHELTHALQDQHYDLEALQRAARRVHGSDALRALVEGDASRVEENYVAELSDEDRDELGAWRARAGAEIDGVLDAKAVPGALIALFQSPYVLGPQMLRVLVAGRDEEAIDDLFREPPVPDASYLTPTTVLEHPGTTTVSVPTLDAGETQVGTIDVFGAFTLYLMLATLGDPAESLRVADGWGGDAMITFTRGDTQCVRAAFVGRDAESSGAIRSALRDWARDASRGSATVDVDGDRSIFTACDPGAATNDPGDAPEAALYTAVFRNTLLAEGSGLVGVDVAKCAMDRMLDDPAFAPIVDAFVSDPTAAPDASNLQRFSTRFQSLLLACR